MNIYQPTMHKPVPMGTRVVTTRESGYPAGHEGEVVGICHYHIIFTYIVLLDRPLESDYGLLRAIPIHGSYIETPDGKNFRLEEGS